MPALVVLLARQLEEPSETQPEKRLKVETAKKFWVPLLAERFPESLAVWVAKPSLAALKKQLQAETAKKFSVPLSEERFQPKPAVRTWRIFRILPPPRFLIKS